MAKPKNMPMVFYTKSFPTEARRNRQLRKELAKLPVLAEYMKEREVFNTALDTYKLVQGLKQFNMSTLDWDVLAWASFLYLLSDNPDEAAEMASEVLEHYALQFWLRVKFVISSLYVFDDIQAVEGPELKEELDAVVAEHENKNPYRHYYNDYILTAFLREFLDRVAPYGTPDKELQTKLKNIREFLGVNHMKRLHVYDAVKPYLLKLCQEEGVGYIVYPDGVWFDGVNHREAYDLIRRAAEQNRLENPEYNLDDIGDDIVIEDNESDEKFDLDDIVLE